MNEDANPGGNLQLQQPKGKAAKSRPDVTRRDSKPEGKPHESGNFNKVNEEKLLISVNNKFATNITSLTSEDDFHSMIDQPLEAAVTDDPESPRSIDKEKIKTPEKLPSKVNPEDFVSRSVSKTEAKKSRLLQNSKTFGKSSTDSAKKFVDTSTDMKNEGATERVDSGSETSDLKSSSKQLARTDVLKDKLNSQNHGNLPKPSDDKLGSSVDP